MKIDYSLLKPETLRAFHKQHGRWIPIAAFGLGFIFDAVMLRRIDEWTTLLQQALYLIISATLIGIELLEKTREIPSPFVFKKIWKYREAFLHFLLGTLLNSYTIFYFKSASTLTSFVFIVMLVCLLTLNEFKRFGKSQTQVHMALWSLCLISYFAALVPILLGSMGVLAFIGGIACSVAGFGFFNYLLRTRLREHPGVYRSQVLLPYAAIQALFVVLYFAHAIPPVPLAVKYMGIFHDVKKSEGGYELVYTRPSWKFWQNGDQSFQARPGDSIFCFMRVFSPLRFNDQLQVRWLYWEEKGGWQSADAIPMPITGGREEGYRGVTRKSNFQPGDWRVQLETLDGREVGRIRFKVESDTSTDEREFKTLRQD